MENGKMKKELQKIVKAYRDNKPDQKDYSGSPYRDKFPKAMLNIQQELNQTATINFGYNETTHQAELEEFRASEIFQNFLKKYGLTDAGKELNQDNRIQLRIRW